MMSDQEKIFPSQLQDAIFQFIMTLITQYRQTMTPTQAAHKAGDWLISLGTTIKREVDNHDSEYQHFANDETKG